MLLPCAVMDPDEALEAVRSWATILLHGTTDGGLTKKQVHVEVGLHEDRAARAFEELDHSLSEGGRLPHAWRVRSR